MVIEIYGFIIWEHKKKQAAEMAAQCLKKKKQQQNNSDTESVSGKVEFNLTSDMERERVIQAAGNR